MKTIDILDEIRRNNNGWVNDKIKLYRQREGDEISVYVFANDNELDDDFDYDAYGLLQDNGFDMDKLDFIENDENVARYHGYDNAYIFHTNYIKGD